MEAVVFVATAVFTGALMHRYCDWKRIPWYVSLTTYVGWYISLAVVPLIMLDFNQTMYRRCVAAGGKDCPDAPMIDNAGMVGLWNAVYWTTFSFTWVVIPLQQSYAYAGEFRVVDKMKRALKENAVFYGIAGAICMAAAIWIAVANNLTGAKFGGFIIAASNAWALFVLISMLGYGLVEVPRKLWRLANADLMLKYYQFRAMSVHEHLENAQLALHDVLVDVRQHSESIDFHDPLREAMDEIVDKCPEKLQSETLEPARPLPRSDINENSLASLHRRVMIAVTTERAAQHMWEYTLDHVWELEDIITNRDHTDHVYVRSFKDSTLDSNAGSKLRWYWLILIRPRLYQALCIVFGVLSLISVWSECFMAVEAVDLSVWSQILHAPHVSGPSLQFLVLLALGYLALCCFYSLFRLRLFSYYQLLPKQQSDANSLLFAAAYLCRLTVSLGYNFLNMIHEASGPEPQMAFSEVMGTMNVIPFFGAEFNVYFPIFVALLCVATTFNLFTKCASALHINTFRFEEDYDHQEIEQGQRLIDRERLRLLRQFEQKRKSDAILNTNKYRDDPGQGVETGSGSSSRAPAPQMDEEADESSPFDFPKPNFVDDDRRRLLR